MPLYVETVHRLAIPIVQVVKISYELRTFDSFSWSHYLSEDNLERDGRIDNDKKSMF